MRIGRLANGATAIDVDGYWANAKELMCVRKQMTSISIRTFRMALLLLLPRVMPYIVAMRSCAILSVNRAHRANSSRQWVHRAHSVNHLLPPGKCFLIDLWLRGNLFTIFYGQKYIFLHRLYLPRCDRVIFGCPQHHPNRAWHNTNIEIECKYAVCVAVVLRVFGCSFA